MATIIREHRRGIWNEISLPNGQIRHELVEWVYTTWTIAMYEGKDDIISITKNNEPTRTYRVLPDSGYAIKIRKTLTTFALGNLKPHTIWKKH